MTASDGIGLTPSTSAASAESILLVAMKLVGWFSSRDRVAIALSGGVDSAVIASAAVRSGCQAIAVTGIGAATSQREIDDATSVARQIGIEHRFLQTDEQQDENYIRNDQRRCYHCKSHLFKAIADNYADRTILTGTNLDDLSDYRPGLQAAQQAAVRSPLAELKIGKQHVRQLAKLWNLPIADKPASPCLASRIAYGIPTTPARLKMVEAAESYLREVLQVDDCRVRVHHQELARIELPLDCLPISREMAQQIDRQLKQLGFCLVTIDLGGLRSGSLNQFANIQLPSQ